MRRHSLCSQRDMFFRSWLRSHHKAARFYCPEIGAPRNGSLPVSRQIHAQTLCRLIYCSFSLFSSPHSCGLTIFRKCLSRILPEKCPQALILLRVLLSYLKTRIISLYFYKRKNNDVFSLASRDYITGKTGKTGKTLLKKPVFMRLQGSYQGLTF